MNQIGALICKDVRIHARFAGTYLVGWPLVFRLAAEAQQAMGLSKLNSVVSAMIPTAISFGALFAIFMAQALIERERGKATFAWIRTLPASDLHIVLAKFAAVLVFGVVSAAGWWVAMLGLDLGLAPWQAFSAWMVWLALAGVSLFCQVLLTGRFAAGTPGLVCFGASGVAFYLSRSPDAVQKATQVWNDPYAHIGLWVGCAAVQACAVVATYLRFHAQDSERLVE